MAKPTLNKLQPSYDLHAGDFRLSGNDNHCGMEGPMTRLLLALLVAVAGLAAMARAAGPELAHERAQRLRHGINASLWFAQSSRDYSVERLRTFTTADDIALMAKLGFDHVRLSVDSSPLLSGDPFGHPGSSPFLAELDRVVDLMLQHHLAVIVDIHPEEPYKAALRTGDDSVERFASLWARLAQHFGTRDPNSVFFEIMNEPEQTDPYRWIGIEARVAAAIRKAAPRNTIIATGANWSGLTDLLQTEPLAMNNVIYTFHDYEPFAFTHQGATWTDSRVQPLRGVPYPSTPEAVSGNLGQATSLAGEFFVEEYGLAQWDRRRVERTLAFAKRWADTHGVPVYCGEFGVLRDYAPPAMRAAWLRDMVSALEADGIGWAMWDYQANFGIVRKENGTTIPDPEIVKALGLKRTGN
jgi:aryl-phospho-beta-D-glucosidase BglC (GH1 family)